MNNKMVNGIMKLLFQDPAGGCKVSDITCFVCNRSFNWEYRTWLFTPFGNICKDCRKPKSNK